jgi:hypothetical protein
MGNVVSRPNYPRKRRLASPGEERGIKMFRRRPDDLVVITLTHCDRPMARIIWGRDEQLSVSVQPRGTLIESPTDSEGFNLNVQCDPPCKYDGIFNQATLTTLMNGVRAIGLTEMNMDAALLEQQSN